MNRADAKPGFSFKDWGIRAIQNTVPGWPPTAIDPSKPFKWQTRRVMKDQPPEGAQVWNVNGQWCLRRCSPWRDIAPPPYRVGQLYYAKEALHSHRYADMTYPIAHYSADLRCVNAYMVGYIPWRWKRDRLNGIFMPRAAARLFYVLRAIRAEEVQRISEQDAIAEGCGDPGFRGRFDEIHGINPDVWVQNPYVWVYEWERVEL